MFLEMRIILKALPGSGLHLRPSQLHTMHAYLKRRAGIVDVSRFQENSENLNNTCCFIAVSIALIMKNIESVKRTRWYGMRKLPQRALNIIKRLYELSNLEYNTPISVNMFQKIHNILMHYFGRSLVVYEQLSMKKNDYFLMFAGRPVKDSIKLLYGREGHYYLISNEKFLLGGGLICKICNQVIENTKTHICNQICKLCKSSECYLRSTRLDKRLLTYHYFCKKCKRFFRSSTCHREHVRTGACDEYYVCRDCSCTVKWKKTHLHYCGQIKCRLCRNYVPANDHRCFIQRPKAKSLVMEPGTKICVFDFETMTDPTTGQLYPNLCIIFVCCTYCIDNDLWYNECCAFRETVFTGSQTLEKTVEFLFFNPALQNAHVFAHFAGRFDTLFLLKQLIRLGHSPRVLTKGQNIIQLIAGNNIRVCDSYNHLPSSLAKLCEAFQTPTQEKSFFPHSLNTSYELSNVPEAFPKRKAFEPGTMGPDRLREFNEWYKRQSSHWIPLKFAIEYCRVDVKILRETLSSYRSTMLQLTGIDPLLSITGSQYAGTVFRSRFMNRSLGIISDRECLSYTRQQSSLTSIKYFEFLNETKGAKLKHAGNSQMEPMVGKYKVDALDGSHVIEFFGCAFHSLCPICKPGVPSNRPHPIAKPLTYYDLAIRDLKKLRYLRKRAFTVTVITECQLNRQLSSSKLMASYFKQERWLRFKQFPIRTAREAFYGTRKLY